MTMSLLDGKIMLCFYFFLKKYQLKKPSGIDFLRFDCQLASQLPIQLANFTTTTYYYDFFFCYLQIYREQFCKIASDNKDAISNSTLQKQPRKLLQLLLLQLLLLLLYYYYTTTILLLYYYYYTTILLLYYYY